MVCNKLKVNMVSLKTLYLKIRGENGVDNSLGTQLLLPNNLFATRVEPLLLKKKTTQATNFQDPFLLLGSITLLINTYLPTLQN